MALQLVLWADVLRWLVNGYLLYALVGVALDRVGALPASRTLPYLGLTALVPGLLPAGWAPARALGGLYPLAPKPVLVALYLLAAALLLWPLARRRAGDAVWAQAAALLALAGWSGYHLLLGSVGGPAGALAWAPPWAAAAGGVLLLPGRTVAPAEPDGPVPPGRDLQATTGMLLGAGAQVAARAAAVAPPAAAVDPRTVDYFRRAVANGSRSPAFRAPMGTEYYHFTARQLAVFDPVAYLMVKIDGVQPMRFQPALGQWREGLLIRYRLGAVSGRAVVGADGPGRWLIQVEHDG